MTFYIIFCCVNFCFVSAPSSLGEADYTSSPASDVTSAPSSPNVSPIVVPQPQEDVTLAEQVAPVEVQSRSAVDLALPSLSAGEGVLDRSLPPANLVFPKLRKRVVEKKLAMEPIYLDILIKGCVAQGLAPESVLNYFAEPGADALEYIQMLMRLVDANVSDDSTHSFYSFIYPHVSFFCVMFRLFYWAKKCCGFRLLVFGLCLSALYFYYDCLVPK